MKMNRKKGNIIKLIMTQLCEQLTRARRMKISDENESAGNENILEVELR